MGKYDVTTETAFEVGVQQGRKQMAEHITEILEVTNDPDVLKKYLSTITKQDREQLDIKGFFKGIRE